MKLIPSSPPPPPPLKPPPPPPPPGAPPPPVPWLAPVPPAAPGLPGLVPKMVPPAPPAPGPAAVPAPPPPPPVDAPAPDPPLAPGESAWPPGAARRVLAVQAATTPAAGRQHVAGHRIAAIRGRAADVGRSAAITAAASRGVEATGIGPSGAAAVERAGSVVGPATLPDVDLKHRTRADPQRGGDLRAQAAGLASRRCAAFGAVKSEGGRGDPDRHGPGLGATGLGEGAGNLAAAGRAPPCGGAGLPGRDHRRDQGQPACQRRGAQQSANIRRRENRSGHRVPPKSAWLRSLVRSFEDRPRGIPSRPEECPGQRHKTPEPGQRPAHLVAGRDRPTLASLAHRGEPCP